VSAEDVGRAVRGEAQEGVNGLRQGEVTEGAAREEQGHGGADEEHRRPLLPGGQPGHDETPDLVEPDRGRDDDTDEEPNGDEDREGVGDAGEVDERGQGGAAVERHLLDRGFEPLEDGVVLPPAQGGTDEDRDQRDDDAVAQLAQVVTERHPSLGITLLA
jgi:hypothetical protein